MSTNHLNRDALIIGICQYDDLPMSAQLDTLAKQAEQLAQLLETQGGFKVRQLPCTPDLKMSFNDRLAISDTIFSDGRLRQFGLEKAIEELFYPANPSPEHVALLFFAGHGLVKSTKAGTEGFLATSEADGKTVYGISLKWLRDLLRNSPIKQQIVFLESCHSGEFFTHFQTDEKRDYCFVTSARAHEAALAEGLLTKALLDILDYTHQPKDTPWVNSDILIENLQQQLTTTEGWQRFEMQTQGHLMLTNYAFSQQVDPNAKPYKGLHYFDNKPEDASFFKGRETLIADLLTKVKTKPFLAVLGASGNGKSSVVRAGVLYQLQQTERWQIVNPFTPTANPLTALTNGLGTTDVLTLVTSAKARVILTIDQFEEVFSLCQDGQARDTFFNTLLDAVEQATGKLCLIVVMRADFLDKCSNYPRLARYFQDHQHIVTRPTEAEIQQIIEAPAKQAGLLVEPRLVAEMITDFKDSLGGLPLLEFALTTLWEKGKADRLLRYADYQALGRIQGILEKKATDTYKDLTPAEQVVAKRVFLELTELGEGKHDTRRLVPQTDLLGLSTTPTSVEQVIAKLAKEHLIVTDKTAVTVVNIAHDALIEHWSVLRKWLDQSREDLKLQRQINEGAKAWKEGKKALLVGVDLARAEEYLGTHLEKVPLSEVGVGFVKASVALREKEVQEREQQRRERERLQRRNFRVLAASFVVAMVLGLFGWWQWGEAQTKQAELTVSLKQVKEKKAEAEKQKQVAEVQRNKAEQQAKVALVRQVGLQARMAADSPSSVNGFVDQSFLLAVQAFRFLENFETQGNLLHVLQSHPRLSKFLRSHRDYVFSVAFSPDGRRLASGSADDSIILWDVETGLPIGTPWRGHRENDVGSVAFSPNGLQLASSDALGNIILWDVKTGTPIKVLRQDRREEVKSIAFSPNGLQLASGNTSGNIILWDIKTGTPIGAPWRGHSYFVRSVAFSPDGLRLASGSWDTTAPIILWNVKTGKPIGIPWKGHREGVENVAFSPDGRRLASGSKDTDIILWDVKTGKPIGAPWKGHRGPVMSVAFSPNGLQLVSGEVESAAAIGPGGATAWFSGEAPGKIILWDVNTGTPIGTPWQGHSWGVTSVAFSADGLRVASGSWDSSIILWDVKMGTPVGTPWQGYSSTVEDVAFSPDSLRLASADRDNGIILRNVNTGTPIGKPWQEGLRVAFSPNGLWLVSSGKDNSIILWDVKTGTRIGTPWQKHSKPVIGVAFSPDSLQLASGSEDNTIILWDVKTGTPIGTPWPHNGVWNVAFSPNGRCLTSGNNNNIILWNVKMGTPLWHSGEVHNLVLSVAFSPNGLRLASGGARDKSIILWDINTPMMPMMPMGAPWQGHSDDVRSVTFSPDGQWLASGSWDKSIILWNVETHTPIGQLKQENQVNRVIFSPNGKLLASNNGNGVMIWDVDPHSWVAKLCRKVNRNFTQEEWRRFFGEREYEKTCPPVLEGRGEQRFEPSEKQQRRTEISKYFKGETLERWLRFLGREYEKICPSVSEGRVEQRFEPSEKQQRRQEIYEHFKRQTIEDKDVPPGMRVIHTPFGDRLVPDR